MHLRKSARANSAGDRPRRKPESSSGFWSSSRLLERILLLTFGIIIGVTYSRVPSQPPEPRLARSEGQHHDAPLAQPEPQRRKLEHKVEPLRQEAVSCKEVAEVRSLCHTRMETRGVLPLYLNQLGLTGEGVEVGVKDGDFSQWILRHWEGQVLHLVDPWEKQDDKIYNDVSNAAQEEQDKRLANIKQDFAKRFGQRWKVHRGYSVPVSKTFEDESLDFVYVDARHDYAGALEDCEHWWPKLKVGGLLAGHDYVPDGMHTEGDFGVRKAVKEFADKHKVETQSISAKDVNGALLEPAYLDGGWTTWYFLKPKPGAQLKNPNEAS